MTRPPATRHRLAADLARGAVAGAAAWGAMDQVLQFLYNHEHRAARRREGLARGGVPALEVLAERAARRAGRPMSIAERQRAGTALQWSVGLGMGALYAPLRARVPAVAAGRGLAFGVGLSLLVDEGLVPLAGLAPGPRAFPWQTHARGLVGHLVFGAVAEFVLTLLDRAHFLRGPRACGGRHMT